MKVTFVCSTAVEDQYPVTWRCTTPAAAIQRTGLHQAAVIGLEAFARHAPEAQAACERADLIVIHRYLTAPVLEAALRWRAGGKKVIVDLDEPLPVTAGPEAPTAGSLRLVDAITSPSARLADDWDVPVPAYPLPDYLDPRRYLDIKPTHGECIRVGLGGGSVSYASLAGSGLLGALASVCRQRPNVRLMLFGADATLTRYLIQSGLPHTALPWVPPADWPQHLAGLDVGLAPIAGEAERRKSWQRLLEYMILSIPWVASDQLPYRALGAYGRLVANTEPGWTQALLSVIDHLDACRAQAAKEAFVIALSQDIDENISRTISLYQTVLRSSAR